MLSGHEKIYPDCPMITRSVEIGGLTKARLMQELQECSILVNDLGERLLASDKFTTSKAKHLLQTVELTIGNLGFSNGATTPEIFKRATELGLGLCPCELGPYLRLVYLDQPEGSLGNSVRSNQAPSGSITIASAPLIEDHSFPKGFYLRRIEGVLWLRGYVADDRHVWSSTDHFIFCPS